MATETRKPLTLRSKFPGRCVRCQRPIVVGESIQYTKDRTSGKSQTWHTACDPEAQALEAAKETAREESRATDADVSIPVPEGLEYLPFQRAGIAYALRRPSTLIGDEMGLGKTIQALGVINADPSIQRVLVVCPASLKLNWRREAERWLVRPMSIGIGTSKNLPETQVLIVNYDILHKHAAALRAITWDLVVVDEAHYLKNPKARRSEQVLGTEARKKATCQSEGKPWLEPIPAHRRLYLTGTPIVNRPVELWPLIASLDPGTWPKFWSYAMRYCGAYKGRYGWDLSGASNLDELQRRLRETILVRRLKKDVLTELPPKRRQVIEVECEGAEDAVEEERAAYARFEEGLEDLQARVELAKAGTASEYEEAVRRLREGARTAFTELARVRHATALAKLPAVLEHLESALDEDKVIFFAHHLDVLHAVREHFGDRAVILTGETPMEERQRAVDRFQGDPAVQLFVGSITAAGMGLTLTASSHVVFGELDWVPGNMTQAEDRAHRIGQTASVLVQHLVLDRSLDAQMARTLIGKQEIIDRALDRDAAVLPVVPAKDRGATEEVSRDALATIAAGITAPQIDAIHAALRLLAGVCDGACVLDGSGFNKIDTRIGKSLAAAAALTPRQAALGQKIARKYRRQLPADLYAAAGGAS